MTAKRYSWPVTIGLAAEALVALALARVVLHRTRPEDILARNQAAKTRTMRENTGPASACAKTAFIIPRLAQRLPWRADCLVQALAAQSMLLRRGVASEIVVGTAKHSDGRFEAHAWLSYSGDIILGGDVARFAPLLESPGKPTSPV